MKNDAALSFKSQSQHFKLIHCIQLREFFTDL